MDNSLRLLVLGALLLAVPARDARSQPYVPEALEAWRQWVLHGEEHRRCPFFMGRVPGERAAHVCAWPRRLNLVVVETGARFEQRWRVFSDSWVPLAGDSRYWPQDVTVDGRAARVVARGDRPQVFLTPGNYRVAGFLRWATRPATLTIPRRTGLVSLTLDGADVRYPAREDAVLYLGERAVRAEEEKKLDIQVYRKVSDGVPVTVTTRLAMDVAGPAREENVGKALMDGFAPMALASPLPSRLEPDGSLTLQVRPGRWVLALTSRSRDGTGTLLFERTGENWPTEEIWSFASDDRLRATSAEGGEPVDPVQAGVPPEWRQLPSFRIAPGGGLDLVVRSRGMSEQTGNELSLDRSMWLDFDGRGFTIRDHVQGTMRRDWRLDMALPYRMKSASENRQSLLVTDGPDPGVTGVELRAPEVRLVAVSRAIRIDGPMPATGYQTSFNSVATTLYLPPGQRLFWAKGADRANAWIDEWRLLDLFLVLIIAVAVGKLINPYWGALALLMLVLTYHEPGAPAWAWLNLLVALALASVAPEGWFRRAARAYRNVSLAVLLVIVVPFAANQARLAVFPQLEGISVATPQPAIVHTPAAPEGAAEQVTVTASRKSLLSDEEAGLDRSSDRPAEPVSTPIPGLTQSYSRYAPKALVQTGPGLPGWAWQGYRLRWSGPVTAEQELRLLVMPAWALSLWRLTGLVVIGVIIAGLVSLAFGFRLRLPLRKRADGTAAMLLGAWLAVLSAMPADAEAQTGIPPPDLLSELRNRLLEPPECSPRCAELTRAVLEVEPGELTMRLWITALAQVAVPLPGDLKSWHPSRIEVDGSATSQLYRDKSDTLWLALEAGTHQVLAEGPMPPRDSVAITFPEPPRYVQVSAEGWRPAGVSENRLLSGAIELIRERAEGDVVTAALSSERFDPFVRVVRRLNFDLDWRVQTHVYRLAPEQGAFTMEIPLIQGESVITAGSEVKNGKVVIAMKADQGHASWESVLPTGGHLVLTAPEDEGATEVWQLAVSHIWNIRADGVPVVMPTSLDPAFWVPEFHPEPGEALALAVERPEGAEGSTLAIDSVRLSSTPGKRSTESVLHFTYRSTRGGQHTVTLPEEAAVLDLSSDGEALPLRPQQGVLPLPLNPGTHTIEIRWRGDAGIERVQRTPEVNLGIASSNITLELDVPRDRWILHAFGPGVGPAILYWPELIVFVIIAMLLGQTKRTPLTRWDWLLLGLGLSTFAWPVLLIVILWLFAVDWRGRSSAEESRLRFNTTQVLLGLFSLVALGSLLASVPSGLLGSPDMQISGYESYGNHLAWFQDRAASTLPQGGTFSVSVWFYKAAILLWALWLSFALLKWLPWAWRCYTGHGFWRGRRVATSKAAGTAAPEQT